jgi:hypothetical protein
MRTGRKTFCAKPPGTFADVAQGADHLRVLARTYPLDLNRVI